MGYVVKYAPGVKKALERWVKCQPQSVRVKARAVLADLSSNPRSWDPGRKHSLTGKFSGRWSCSLGFRARLIYNIDDAALEVLGIEFTPDHYGDSLDFGL